MFTAKDISESLLKKITTESNLSYIPAIKWGIDNENTAKEQYVSKMLATHKNFVCSQAGFVVNPLYPFLGATPDGFVYCDCCGYGVLEIKCPFSVKDSHPLELQHRKSFLNHQGLVHTHKYYTQVQGQLLLCERQYCDLVVWTTVEFVSFRIYKDIPFTEKLLTKLTKFFVRNLLPELMTHRLLNKEHYDCDNLSEVYCFCHKEEYGKMIQCDNPQCKYVWFHYRCVNLTRAPKGSWYCSECEQ